jgi:hypothetical protein
MKVSLGCMYCTLLYSHYSLDQVCILIKKSHEAKLLFAGTKKRLKSWKNFEDFHCSVADPDSHGSASFWEAGSGSASK